MGFLIRLYRRLICRPGRLVGDEVYGIALELARRGSLRDVDGRGVPPGEWL
jgi:hypothetical protein